MEPANEFDDTPAGNAEFPFFSIVIPTCDRIALLRRALGSVAEQQFRDFEVLIVDDGSAESNLSELSGLLQDLGSRFRLISADQQRGRNGPNGSRNIGMAAAKGRYIGFLDDDDYWCDAEHLAVAKRALEHSGADAYIADQLARRDESTVVECWLPYLRRKYGGADEPGSESVRDIERGDLLQPEGIGFAHVNITLLRRELIKRVGGFWRKAPYEGDLNFFLRWVDKAESFIYRPAVVSVNTLRPIEAGDGVSSIDNFEKQLFRILICQHAEAICETKEVRSYIRLLHSGVLKTWAKERLEAADYELAAQSASRAVSIDPSFRWRLIAWYLRLRSVIVR